MGVAFAARDWAVIQGDAAGAAGPDGVRELRSGEGRAGERGWALTRTRPRVSTGSIWHASVILCISAISTEV
jgi:hypothetical protein